MLHGYSALESGVNAPVPSPGWDIALCQGVQIGAYELLGKQGFTFFKLTSDNLGIKTVYLVSFASSQNKDSAQMFSLSYFT